MPAIYKYRIHCNTESSDKYWFLQSTDPSPTKCPTDSAHEVDLSSVVVLQIGAEEFKKNLSGGLVVDTTNGMGVVGAQSITLNSHDWSDRSTWYQRSVRVTDETLVDSGNALTFNSANPFWINMDSDRLTYDYKTTPERNGVFSERTDRRPVVKVNDVAIVFGADFTVDYTAGTITFSEAKAAEIALDGVPITVKCSYSHTNNIAKRSEWILCPPPGCAYLIDYIEMQFSKNVQFNANIVIEIWAGGNQLGPVPDVYGDFDQATYDQGFGQNKSTYRGAKDFLNICTNRASQIIPAFGGMANDMFIFPFDYLIQAQIRSSQGAVISISLDGEIPYGAAELATATFYMQLVPESSL